MFSSLVKKITESPYQDYSNFQRTFDSNNNFNNLLRTNYAAAFGENYNFFQDKQVEDIKQVYIKLKPIGGELLELHVGQMDFLQEYSLFCHELKKILETQNAKLAEKENKEKIQQKMQDRLDSDQKKLDTAKSAGKTEAAAKLENTVSTDEANLNDAKANAQKAEQDYNNYMEESKTKFPALFVDKTISLVRKLQASSQKNNQIGSKILEVAQQFHDFDDPSSKALRDRLELWNQTTV
ncbi:hypothetical protein TVAG_118240 [Trichomonas vaginalis G3]|uniref:Uncharacterized protein n=1 Tax=Trichomonas vaginalis (strain ATCC PRA-98 / G3) TaxID=412133 RepID=A2EI11_TRIV3|nr:hypothetical protein TVAGG3_0230490 [Trichomonas vaginalis G3]EAY07743.1 hypothetical protein TVAG_118240 [Trichomonas vaginalis G3]KAI5552590.1 hypothetical protein TVAGG3_0230490 [Trichomonas vaginalis G3]|eukprot:XP_001319966.1 hypothetical protein [Trichomonas vaginalis G3]